VRPAKPVLDDRRNLLEPGERADIVEVGEDVEVAVQDMVRRRRHDFLEEEPPLRVRWQSRLFDRVREGLQSAPREVAVPRRRR